jgi:hypothetical protein
LITGGGFAQLIDWMNEFMVLSLYHHYCSFSKPCVVPSGSYLLDPFGIITFRFFALFVPLVLRVRDATAFCSHFVYCESWRIQLDTSAGLCCGRLAVLCRMSSASLLVVHQCWQLWFFIGSLRSLHGTWRELVPYLG